MRIFSGSAVALYLTVIGSAMADSHTTYSWRPDAHAPIGVMRDHVHQTGKWMFSYRYDYMFMGDNRDGTSEVTPQQVLNQFNVAPTEMVMKMHMLGGMYGITDQLTFAIMGGYTETDMDHTRANGTRFSTQGDAISDTQLSGLYEFYNDGFHRLQLNTGVSVPTGSIDEEAGNGNVLPYPMQTGSGTYDLLPGISYAGYAGGDWSWGGQLNGVVRLGENSHGYRLGDRLNVTAWTARRMNDVFSLSARLDGHAWGDITGADNRIAMVMAPTMNPNLFAGERMDVLLGVNAIVPHGPLAGHRFAVEAGTPVYQRLDGPRLQQEYRLVFGWQKSF
jgi:hypothetical protein